MTSQCLLDAITVATVCTILAAIFLAIRFDRRPHG